MALIFTDSIPTAEGFEVSNLYMVVDAQYTITSQNVMEFACAFYASKTAFEQKKKPVMLGQHPLAALSNGIKANLSEVINAFQFSEPKQVSTGVDIFNVMSAAYYELAKQEITKIEAATGITINYTQE